MAKMRCKRMLPEYYTLSNAEKLNLRQFDNIKASCYGGEEILSLLYTRLM